MAKASRLTFIQRSRQKGASEKAAFHQVLGAGKSRVKRPFLGFTEADADQIVRRVERHLDQRFR